jgi:ferritin-like metal-binding protein YciE
METLRELFEETLKDVYFAEKAIIKNLPKMAKQTKSPELRQAFEEHVEQTQAQVQRLEQIFKLLGKKAEGKECPALMGLVQETEEFMGEARSPEVMHAGLIGCAQAVEHYEIARYGTLRAWAEQLGMDEAAELLDITLDEEKMTDELLSKIAESGLNRKAAKAEGGEDEPEGIMREDEDDEERPDSKRKMQPERGGAKKSAAKSGVRK